MKILHLSPYFHGGGAERCARELCVYQHEHGDVVQMWTARRDERDPPYVRSLRFSWERYLMPLDFVGYYVDWRHLGSRFHLSRITREQFDVVHLHNVHGNWASLSAIADLCRRVPVVWTHHDEWGPTAGLVSDLSRVVPRDEVERLTARSSRFMPYHETADIKRLRAFLRHHMPQPAALIGASAHTVRLMEREGWFPDVPKHHIPYGLPLVDEPATQMPRAEARHAWGLPTQGCVLLLIAQYLDVPHKGIDLAIEALRALPASKRPHLLVLGHGGQDLRAQLPEFQITAGYASDAARLASAYRAADLMVIPSRAECFGYVIVEAFACETPVVGFSIGSLPELLSAGERGIEVPAFDATALSSAIETLLTDDELRTRMGASARQWVRRECDMPTIAGRIGDVYRQAISRLL